MPLVQVIQPAGTARRVEAHEIGPAPEILDAVDVAELTTHCCFHQEFHAASQVVERSATHQKVAVGHPYDVLLIDHALLAVNRLNLRLRQGLQRKERACGYMLDEVYSTEGALAQVPQHQEVGAPVRHCLVLPVCHVVVTPVVPHRFELEEDILSEDQHGGLAQGPDCSRSRGVFQQCLLPKVRVLAVDGIGFQVCDLLAVNDDL
mmetsp:Transcript_69893/g.97179  ORF Transcript_69893/g.97179 Transcript_69893/m.97179 type:complete len:205 (-) Transcript_69893:280-894(-)